MYKLKENIGKIKVGSLMTITHESSQKEIKKAIQFSPSLIHNFDKINLKKKSDDKRES